MAKIFLSLGAGGILPVFAALALVYADAGEQPTAESKTETPAVLRQMEDTAEQVGKKLEQGVNKMQDKFENKQVGKRIEQKADKAVTKTGEGPEKADKKTEEKLGK